MLQLHGHQGPVHAIVLARGGSVVSAGRDQSIRIWDIASGTETACLRAHDSPVLSIALHPSGRALASGASDGCVKLWDLSLGRVIESYPGQISGITGLAWTAGKTNLMMVCGERLRPDRPGEMRIWNFESKPPTRSVRVEQNGFWSLAAARHASIVAWSGGMRGVSVWDMNYQQPKQFRQPTSSLVVALSADGQLLASATDRSIHLWSVERGIELAVLEGHRGLIRALAFSPDGATLASGGQDQSVRFWNVRERGSPGPVFAWPIGAIHSLSFSEDGLTAIAGGDTGSLWVWDVAD